MSTLLQISSLLQGQYLALFLSGVETSAELFFISWASALLLAVFLSIVRAAPIRIGTWLVRAFVEYHRNVPSLVQLFVWYFGVPQILPDNVQGWLNGHHGELVLAIIALALNAAAYMSEDLRSGLRALPRSQLEAARALGMTYLQAMWLIIIPQAVRLAAPSLINQTLGLFKTTSLAMAIGVAELMYIARQIEGDTYMTFACFAIASVVYLCGSFSIMAVGAHCRRKFAVIQAAR